MASIKKRGKTWYVRFSKRETQWDPENPSMKSVLKQKSRAVSRPKLKLNNMESKWKLLLFQV